MSDLKDDLTEVPGTNDGVWVYNPKSKSYELAAHWPEGVTFVNGLRLMASEAKNENDDVWRKKLYGRFTSDAGQRIVVSLCKWRGVPPPDGKIVALECLEHVFRKCVKKAMMMLAKVKDDTNNRPLSMDDRARAEREFIIAQRLKRYGKSRHRREVHISKAMERFVECLGDRWNCTLKQAAYYKSVVQDFTSFVKSRHNKDLFLVDVPREDMSAYLDKQEALAPGTYNKRLMILRRVFKELAPYSEAADVLTRRKKKDEDSVTHEPFSDPEVDSIIEMAGQVDSLVRSMVIIAVCTGLRLKDICLMEWSCMDTDFSKMSPLINLTTNKNKGDAIIGMWPMLKTELERLWKTREPGAVYVLPEAAAIYQRNVKSLLTRLEKVLKLLGYGEEGMDARRVSLNMEPEPDRVALMSQVEAALVAAGDCPAGRRQSILNVLDLYLNGKSLPQIAASSGLSKGTVSNYLHRAEKLTGRIIIRQRVMPVVFQGDTPKPLTVKPERAGVKRVAVRKWHSFRTTFFIAAVRAGSTIELLKKILGSRTTDVLFKHYFRPDKELIHEGFTTKVPAYALNKVAGSPALSDAPRMVNATPAENRLKLAAARLKTLTPENANELRNELLKLLED